MRLYWNRNLNFLCVHSNISLFCQIFLFVNWNDPDEKDTCAHPNISLSKYKRLYVHAFMTPLLWTSYQKLYMCLSHPDRFNCCLSFFDIRSLSSFFLFHCQLCLSFFDLKHLMWHYPDQQIKNCEFWSILSVYFLVHLYKRSSSTFHVEIYFEGCTEFGLHNVYFYEFERIHKIKSLKYFPIIGAPGTGFVSTGFTTGATIEHTKIWNVKTINKRFQRPREFTKNRDFSVWFLQIAF